MTAGGQKAGSCPLGSGLAVMHTAIGAGDDGIISVDVPQAGTVRGLMLRKRPLHDAEAGHRAAAQAKAGSDTRQVAPAMDYQRGIEAAGPEFVDFGAIAAIVDD